MLKLNLKTLCRDVKPFDMCTARFLFEAFKSKWPSVVAKDRLAINVTNLLKIRKLRILIPNVHFKKKHGSVVSFRLLAATSLARMTGGLK